jgi:hypothetical protein
MTKKHFIALADKLIKIQRDGIWNSHTYQMFQQSVLPELADFCAEQNPRFDRERWLGYIAGTNGPNGGRVKL